MVRIVYDSDLTVPDFNVIAGVEALDAISNYKLAFCLLLFLLGD